MTQFPLRPLEWPNNTSKLPSVPPRYISSSPTGNIFPTHFGKLFYKPNFLQCQAASIPTSITADTTIRIVLHSAEVVHFHHEIQIPIVSASSLHTNICHDKYPIVVFHLLALIQDTHQEMIPLNTGVQEAVSPGVAKSPTNPTLRNATQPLRHLSMRAQGCTPRTWTGKCVVSSL